MPDVPQSRPIMTLRAPSGCSTQLHPAIRPEAGLSANQHASVPSKITENFSQSSVAIALAVSKSKPAGLSTKDYLEQLRKHVKTGQPLPQDKLRYIDTAEFWKGQFTRLHLEKKALEDEILCLQEARRLSKKRRREIFEQDALIDSQDSLGMQGGTQSQLLDDVEISPVNDVSLRLSSYALRLRRHRNGLERCTMDFNSLDKINTFAKQILGALAHLENAFSDCCLPLKLFKDSDEESKISFAFRLVMNQFELSFLVCLTAIDALCKTIPGRTNKAEIVYRMVMIFKQGLDILRSISVDQVAHERAAVRDHNASHKRQKFNPGEYLVNNYLAKALAAIAQNAQWKIQQPAHSEILEGLLFSILEHTGRLVSEAVFGEQVATSELPGNITQENAEAVEGFVSPEARYIVQVLYATVGTGNQSDLVARMLAARRTPLEAQLRTAVPSSPAFGDLLLKGKRLLQGTLVKSALGDTDLESLRLPNPPLDLSNVSVADSVNYGKDWLIEMVWGLVGWDIVCSK